MKITFSVILAVTCYLLISGCSHPKSAHNNAVTGSKDSINAIKENLSWADSAVEYYIQHASNAFIASVRHDSVHLRWMEDTAILDGVNYKRIQLGLDNSIRFQTIAWLYLDTFKRKIYEYDLPNDSLILWQAGLKRAIEAAVVDGNLYLVYNNGNRECVKKDGGITTAIMSPNNMLVAFLRETPVLSDTDYQCPATTSLYLYHIDADKEEQAVGHKHAPNPEDELEVFDNIKFSADGLNIYFTTCAWATSGAIHSYNISSHTEKFISDGNGLTIIKSGKYEGYLITQKHKYYNNTVSGSYDHNFLLTPDGKEVRDIGEEEFAQ